jgi:hypothetical protein
MNHRHLLTALKLSMEPRCEDLKPVNEDLMKNIRRVFAALSTVAAMSGVLGASTVHAADPKVFPAINCVKVQGNGAEYYAPAGQVFNSASTNEMVVRCPLVRDNPPDSWTAVQVVAIDQSFDADVRCRAISASRDGNSRQVSAYGITSGNGSTGQVIRLPPPSAYDYGSYLIECRIPPTNSADINSGVASFYIVEP